MPKDVQQETSISIPVFISRYGKWFVATVPQLDLVTKGGTFEEAKENVHDLLKEYFNDPDTPKPSPESLSVFDIAFIPVNIGGVSHRETEVTA